MQNSTIYSNSSFQTTKRNLFAMNAASHWRQDRLFEPINVVGMVLDLRSSANIVVKCSRTNHTLTVTWPFMRRVRRPRTSNANIVERNLEIELTVPNIWGPIRRRRLIVVQCAIKGLRIQGLCVHIGKLRMVFYPRSNQVWKNPEKLWIESNLKELISDTKKSLTPRKSNFLAVTNFGWLCTHMCVEHAQALKSVTVLFFWPVVTWPN